MPRKILPVTIITACFILLALVCGLFAFSPNSSAQSVSVSNPLTSQKGPAPVSVSPEASQALAKLQGAVNLGGGGEIVTHVSPKTGVYDFVRASGTSVLVSDNALMSSPESRARAFLSQHGSLVGLTGTERALAASSSSNTAGKVASALSLAGVTTDKLGTTHVKFNQTYQGLKVFGAQVIVHLNARGIKAVNGSFVPGVKVSKTPKVTSAQAARTAVATVTKSPDENLSVKQTELAVYRTGLLEGYKGQSVLAYSVEVAGPATREQVWVNAQTGQVITRIPLNTDALHRIVYSPSYDPANPDDNKVREEGDPTVLPAPSNPPDNLYHYTGQSYNLFASAFGRDSYDGAGITMRTVYLISDFCPNATWNGQSTNYCPDFDKDDIVAHEWGHAYTEYTHNLIYAYQSGALNESYSDIFGETIDLHNGVDGAGGFDNANPTTYTIQNGQYVPSGGGVRWRVGEDLAGLSQPAALGILRDMMTPEAFKDPSNVSSDLYYCGSDQSTAVHTNSAVPNKAFALLVDGGTFNDQTIQGIGFTRALHIYYRAMTAYQTPTTNFAEHEQALRASCNDLINAPLTNFSTMLAVGTPSTDVITSATCQQVGAAMAAVEMSTPPVQCNYQKLLDPNTPEECDGSNTVFSENWETGMDGWTLDNQGVTGDWPGTDWTTKNDLPANPDGSAHTGTAAFAINPRIGEPNGGTCTPGGDVSGHFWMNSPEITVPAGASDLKLSFTHYVETEGGYDGGNVKISVNGGAFNLVPTDQYVFNPPNADLEAAPTNTNPNAGERAYTGTNEGELVGSWGTTVINLSNLTSPGDKVRIQFDFGQDGCNGSLGWIVDDVRVYACPVLEGPALALGSDYEDPDEDGAYTLNWTRPTGATGPDVVQESTSCGPVFTDDASETLVAGANSKWAGSPQWTSQPNPGDSSTAYYIPDGASQNESLALKNAISIPAGASSTLTFTTRQGLEFGYDFGHVEVSTDGGANYVKVASYTGPEGVDPLAVFEGAREIDLSQFAGQSVKIRFRVESDPFNIGQPAGWYVDNISVTASNFQTVASGLGGTSHTFTNKPDGNFCYRVATAYTDASGVTSSPFSNVVNVTVDNIVCLTNVAASANGGTAFASSVYPNGDFSPSGAIDGERTGVNWAHGGGWNDGTRGTYPDSLEVRFNGAKRLNMIRVYTLQDNYYNGQEPTATTGATTDGLIDFDIQAWDGNTWVTVPGGAIRGNALAVRAVVLPGITTDKIRVLVHDGRVYYSRIVEVEAIGCDAQ